MKKLLLTMFCGALMGCADGTSSTARTDSDTGAPVTVTANRPVTDPDPANTNDSLIRDNNTGTNTTGTNTTGTNSSRVGIDASRDNSARDNLGTGNTERDNTEVNVRDRASDTKTPIDQNENSADIDITAKIRSKIVDTEMSVAAQNIKIITQNKKVTLRGPVRTEQEKKSVEDIAEGVAGAGNVDSQLEVDPD